MRWRLDLVSTALCSPCGCFSCMVFIPHFTLRIPHWNAVYPFLFKIGPLQVASFGVMMTLGFIVALLTLRRELVRKSFEPALSETLAAAAMIGGLAGAKIYFIIEAWTYVRQDPYTLILSGAGFTFFGGFMGGAIAVLVVLRIRRLPIWPIVDAIAPAIPVGYGLGRIGCQLAGDGDYGSPTDLPWGMAYPDGIVPTMERVHPTPVYEALYSGVIFWILWKLRFRLVKPGQLFCVYLILAGFARFMVEFLRLNPSVLLGLSDAQIIGLLMTFGGGLWLLAMRRKKDVSGEW